MRFPDHKTRIVATIGPASEDPKTLRELVMAGLNVARLNFSHGSEEDHRRLIQTIRSVSEETGRRVAILGDLPGPKIRIGDLAEEPIELLRDDTITLTTRNVQGTAELLSVSFPGLPTAVKPDDRIYINDGFILLKVQEVQGDDVVCSVRVGGELRSRKGLNLPGIDLGISAFTEQDHDWLRFAAANGVDALSQSFVATAADMEAVREAAAALGYQPFLIAKIERAEALGRLDAILAASDGIMVARGDLGVEIPIEEIALTQKRIVARANRAGKPVITATQMLESMVKMRRPTRAEATDVANAILDGTDAVMLSEETAAGQFPVEAVQFLDRVSRVTEEHFPYTAWLRGRALSGRQEIPESVSYSACEMALDLEAAAILTNTEGGGTARLISRFRPRPLIVAVTAREDTWRRLCLSWGVFPLLAPPLRDTDQMLQVVEQEALKAEMLQRGDRVIITTGTPIGTRGSTNLIKADVIS